MVVSLSLSDLLLSICCCATWSRGMMASTHQHQAGPLPSRQYSCSRPGMSP